MTAFSAAQSVMNTMSNMGGMLNMGGKPIGKQDQPPARPAPTPGPGANPLIPQ